MRPNGHTIDSCPGSEFPDLALKGFLGIGTSRIQITNAADPATVNGGDDISPTGAPVSFAISNTYWTTGVDHRGNDAARPRYAYVSFPNQANDKLTIGTRLLVAFKSGAAAAAGSVSVVIAAGTSSGIKLTFTQGATVETWDNVTATVAGVLTQQAATPSNLVRIYKLDDQSSTGAVTTGSGTLLNVRYLGVKAVVEACWPLGVEWYEGPDNEPDVRKNPVRYANDTFMFKEAVKAGNASAKIFGPSMVDITTFALGSTPPLGINALYKFLIGDGDPLTEGPPVAAKDYLDGIGIHVYSMGESDIDIKRGQLDAFYAMLAVAGCSSLPVWQGELGVITPVYRIYRPRHGSQQLMNHLILEQYGITKERNNLWYDASHGFWGFPGFWRTGAQSIQPYALMLRVMAEEVFGKTFEQRLSFGTGIGEHVFIGSNYLAADGSRVIALISASHFDANDVVLQLAGASLPSSVTYRDAQGRTNTAPVTAGKVSVPVTNVPTWVRLPVGVTATVSTFLGLKNPSTPNLAGRQAWATFDGASGIRQPVDGGLRTGTVTADLERTFRASPDNLVIKLNQKASVTDVVVFCGPPWQSWAALKDFDVETSIDNGATWTTRKTVNRTGMTSFYYVSASSDNGCTRESYWDEQWIYPVKLDAPVLCNAIRLVIRNTSRGGEPDSASESIGGQGWGTEQITISEVYVLSDLAEPTRPLVAVV